MSYVRPISLRPSGPLALGPQAGAQNPSVESSDTLRYLTVQEFAWRVRRTAKTAYNWINKGIIGADDGVVKIQGRIFIDWPVYSARQIRPYRRIEDCLRDSGV